MNLVLAVTYQAYVDWLRERGVGRQDRNYRYIPNADALRGYHGATVHYVGDWTRNRSTEEVEDVQRQVQILDWIGGSR